jgi:anaerobic selenocysteine-containing dehydrogenase
VLCAKGRRNRHHAGHRASRLRAPLRTGRAARIGAFEEISWDEALALAANGWMKPLRENAPEEAGLLHRARPVAIADRLLGAAFGTPNYAAHGGFCSVNMAAAGIYTIGGAFWEFGQPDWERVKLFVLFGVAEDHDSNPIKIGIGKLKERGARMISVNPVRTGYNAVADDWSAITPGTDGLLILSL